MTDAHDDAGALQRRLRAYGSGVASMVAACQQVQAEMVALADMTAGDPTVSSAARQMMARSIECMAAVLRNVAADLRLADDTHSQTEH